MKAIKGMWTPDMRILSVQTQTKISDVIWESMFRGNLRNTLTLINIESLFQLQQKAAPLSRHCLFACGMSAFFAAVSRSMSRWARLARVSGGATLTIV
jgi:hypothetical protein